MSDVMFTANRLDNGAVIWLTAALRWSEAARQAAVFSDDGARPAAGNRRLMNVPL